MRMPQGAEWLIILLLILVLFGAKRLPDAARGLGRSLRILKSETKGLRDDDEPESGDAVLPPANAPAALPEVARSTASELDASEAPKPHPTASS